jgi:hypothetical protein
MDMCYTGMVKVAPWGDGRGNEQCGFRPVIATPGISRHSFPRPVLPNERRKPMLKEFKEAPKKAIQVAFIALGVALLALFVSLGKVRSNA